MGGQLAIFYYLFKSYRSYKESLFVPSSKENMALTLLDSSVVAVGVEEEEDDDDDDDEDDEESRYRSAIVKTSNTNRIHQYESSMRTQTPWKMTNTINVESETETITQFI